MQQDRSYTNDSPPTSRGGFVLVDPATIRRAVAAFKAERAIRTTCWFCWRPLTNGLCARCDAESML